MRGLAEYSGKYLRKTQKKTPCQMVQGEITLWSCGDSNPGPDNHLKSFYVRSSCLGVFFGSLALHEHSQTANLATSNMSLCVESSTTRGEFPSSMPVWAGNNAYSDKLQILNCLGSCKSEVVLRFVCSYLFTATLSVVSCLHRHASFQSVLSVETNSQPHCLKKPLFKIHDS